MDAYYSRGLAKYELRDHADAIADFDRVIKLNSDDADARKNLETLKISWGC